MHITKIALENYRSFYEPTEILLQPGMNLLLGENNSGKSTILQALQMSTIDYEPHLSIKTKPLPSTILRSPQRISMDVYLRTDEVSRCLGDGAIFPIPEPRNNVHFDMPSHMASAHSIDVGFEFVRVNNGQKINFYFTIGGAKYGDTKSGNLTGYQLPGNGSVCGGSVRNFNSENVFSAQWNRFQSVLYRFRAERLSPHKAQFGASTVLAPDASNLAECLNSLQSQQSHLFEEYISYVNHIFPSVHRVQAVAVVGQTALEIRAWLVPAHARRADLSIPLSHAGTGIGQVLAILYVAMSSLEPIVIGIDEPNSFLHPKAVRSLLQILNALPVKHQYIITTHSPEVLRAADPRGITVVTNNGGISTVQVLDPLNIEHIKDGLASIGARLSDVYGADEILWVEGETEEMVFPKIAADVAGLDIVGIAMLKVSATGDFERNRRLRPRMVFQTYKKLSNAGALVPPAIGFIFDREDRSDREIDDLKRESGDSVVFLDRRCYENYIINADAIAFVLSQESNSVVSSDRVAKWVEENGCSPKYIDTARHKLDGAGLWDCDDWIRNVNAPRLLADIFSELPENPAEYRKTKHSIAITEWIIGNDRERLRPVADVLLECLRARRR